MRKYYLAGSFDSSTKNYTVFVTDNTQGLEILKEFEAKSYSEAVKMFSFSARNMGKSAYCGVDKAGNPYSGTTE